MASVTFAIDKDLKPRLDKFPWVNWSETARQELIKRDKLDKAVEQFKELAAKSDLSKDDAKDLADKISKSMHDSLVKKGLI